MRKVREIEADLAQERMGYHEAAAAVESVPELQERSARIKELMVELSSVYTVGANSCPTCGSEPHGMRRRPGVIEVGCIGCPDHRAQGESVEDAVDRWNTGDWGGDLAGARPSLEVLVNGDEEAGIPPNPELGAALEKLGKSVK